MKITPENARQRELAARTVLADAARVMELNSLARRIMDGDAEHVPTTVAKCAVAMALDARVVATGEG